MRFTWSDATRKLNIEQHGLDFVDTPRVFEGPTYTYEDDRFDNSEQRFVTLAFSMSSWFPSSTPRPHA
jgi:uncharacterized DUF497 family protein